MAEAARRIGASVVVIDEPAAAGRRAGTLALGALAASARTASRAARAGQFGITVDAAAVSLRRVHDHVSAIAADAVSEDAGPRLTALGIEMVRGTARFSDPRMLKVGESAIRARRFVIATGAAPGVPDVPGLHAVPYFTTETIFDNTRKLAHLVVIGAGPMGLELALAYARFGSAVTFIEPGRVLPQADPELVEIVLRRLRDEGVVLVENAALARVEVREGGVAIVVDTPAGRHEIAASHLLVATGRVPRLGALNLEAARIRRAKADPAALALSTALRTTNPRVFAVGAAAGHPGQHYFLEANLVVRAALLGESVRFDSAALPRLTLTDPELAEVGLTEQMAHQRFKSGYAVLRAGYAGNDKARADRDGMGVAKLVVAPSGRILGAGIAGPGAAELAALFALAIEQKIEASRLAELASPAHSYADLARTLGAMAVASPREARGLSRRLSFNRLLP